MLYQISLRAKDIQFNSHQRQESNKMEGTQEEQPGRSPQEISSPLGPGVHGSLAGLSERTKIHIYTRSALMPRARTVMTYQKELVKNTVRKHFLSQQAHTSLSHIVNKHVKSNTWVPCQTHSVKVYGNLFWFITFNAILSFHKRNTVIIYLKPVNDFK